MATENHDNENAVVKSNNLQADRQYLVDSGTNRLIMTLLLIGGIGIASVLLFLASWGKTGRYINPDTTQYEASLSEAATMLEGGAVAPDNADRVTLPIGTAIRATADKGLGAITTSLKQVGAPPAPEPVVEEAVVETVVEEVVVEEVMETTVETPVVEETVGQEVVVQETVVEEVVVEAPVVEEVVVEEVVVEQPVVEVTETTTEVVETTTIGVTPTVETATSTVNTTTSSTSTSTTAESMVLGVAPGVVASTITMASGLQVAINKDVYSACVSCHQVNGQGIITVFPPLANHAAKLFNTDRDYLPNVVLYGLEGTISVDGLSYNQPMRGYPELSDADIAGVLNYILTTWGNESLLAEDFRPYEPNDIAGLRGQNLTPDLMQTMRTTLSIN